MHLVLKSNGCFYNPFKIFKYIQSIMYLFYFINVFIFDTFAFSIYLFFVGGRGSYVTSSAQPDCVIIAGLRGRFVDGGRRVLSSVYRILYSGKSLCGAAVCARVSLCGKENLVFGLSGSDRANLRN